MHRWLAVLFAMAVGASLASAALAADLGGGRSKIATPPPPPPAPDAALPPVWSGLYVGAHGGYSWSNVDWEQLPASGSDGGTGWLLGGQIGYNWQTGRLVFGVEGDVTSSWVEGGNTCCDHSLSWLYSLRGRVGIAGFDNRMLFYVTAGGAWADFDYTSGFGRFSDTQFGWVAGGGIERALTPNLSARIEYLYYDFDSVTAPAGTLAAGATSLDPSMHTVRFGLNYRF
jgi:outer membrane immunogenic protein